MLFLIDGYILVFITANLLARVVQTLDSSPDNSALHSGYLSGKLIALYIQWIEIYPVDSIIHVLNNWDLTEK